MNDPVTMPVALFAAVALAACTTSDAWIAKRTKSGGRIAYAEAGMFTDKADVLVDFKKAAKQLCYGKPYVVEKQYLPPPDGVVSAARGSKGGMLSTTISHNKRKDGLLFKDVPWEYDVKGSLDSWHEAEVRCKK